MFGALALFSDVNLKNKRDSEHFFTPKFLLRLSPGSMREQSSGSRLTPLSAFDIDRINDTRNYETGSVAQ